MHWIALGRSPNCKKTSVSAMAYPVFLFSVGTVVIVALLVFFVPKFDMLFDRLRRKGEMPWATEALLTFSQFLQQWGWLFLVVMVIVLVYQIKNSRARRHLDESCRRSILPRARHVARQRRADPEVAGD